MTEQISWQRFNDANAARVINRLGADHVAWIMKQPMPAITARGRADGMWYANEGESWSAYMRLAELIEAGAIRVAAGRAVAA